MTENISAIAWKWKRSIKGQEETFGDNYLDYGHISQENISRNVSNYVY